MKSSLVITTYNWPKALFRVLESSAIQSVLPDEIIIADDGSLVETKNLISSFQKHSPVPIIHSWHEDKGFRLAESRNSAVKKSSGDYLIFIDGDIIMHKNFIEDHMSLSKSGQYIQGTRVLMNDKLSQKILKDGMSSINFFSPNIINRKNTLRSKLLSSLAIQKNNPLKGVRGCNFALSKNNYKKVNGFNNDFKSWGREDSEFVSRLKNAGIRRYDLKNKALCFHLHHDTSSSKASELNEQMYLDSIKNKTQTCSNGLDQL